MAKNIEDNKTIIEVKNLSSYFSKLLYSDNTIRFVFGNKKEIVSSNFLKFQFLDNGDVQSEIINTGNKYMFGFLTKDMLEYYNNVPVFKKEFEEIFKKENKKNIYYIIEKKEKEFFEKKAKKQKYVIHYYATNFKAPKKIEHSVLIKNSFKNLFLNEKEVKEYKENLQHILIDKPFDEKTKEAFKIFILTQIKQTKSYLSEIAENFIEYDIKNNDLSLYEYLNNVKRHNKDFLNLEYVKAVINNAIIRNFTDLIKIPYQKSLLESTKPYQVEEEIKIKIKEYFKNHKDKINPLLLKTVQFMLDKNSNILNWNEIIFDYLPSIAFLKNIDKVTYLTNIKLEDFITENNKTNTLKYTDASLFFIQNIEEYIKSLNSEIKYVFPVFQKINSNLIKNINNLQSNIINIKGEYYFTNIKLNGFFYFEAIKAALTDKTIKTKEVLKKHIVNQIQYIEDTEEKKERIKDNVFDLIEQKFSPINEIDLNTVFEDFTSLENNQMISLENLFTNPLTKTVLLDLSSKKGIFKALAEKYNISTKTFKIMINSLGEDFSNVIDTTLNEKNLGILKYAYIPIVKIQTDEEKESFIDKFKQYFQDKFDNQDSFETNIENLKSLIKNGDYIIVGNQIEKKEDSNVFESLAKPLIINEYLDKIGYLDVSIIEYEKFLQNKLNFKLQNYIKNPSVPEKAFFEIINKFLAERLNTYKKILNDYTYKYAFEKIKDFFSFDVKNNDIHSKIYEKPEELAAFSVKVFGSAFYQKKLFDKTIQQCKQIIDSINVLSPVQKGMLIDVIKNPDRIGEMKDKLDRLFIELKNLYPQKKKEIEEKIVLLNQKTDKITDTLIKETESFLYTAQILFYKNYLMKKYQNESISQEQKENIKKEILLKIWKTFHSWATEAVGLTEDQFQDGFNAFILSISGKKNTIGFGYSMGTGKTRLVLFYLYLNSLFKKKSFFFIQNKNKTDIEEQLKEMLYSLYLTTNKYFSDNINDSSQIPFDIIDEIFPNLFTSHITKYIISSDMFSQTYLKEKYYIMCKKYYSEISKFDLKTLSNIINQKPYYKEFVKDFKDIYNKKIRTFQSNFFMGKTDIKTINSYLNKIFKNYAVSVFWVNDLIKNNNVSNNAKFVDEVRRKVNSDLQKIFKSLKTYIENQKNNYMAICSNFILSHFPKEKQKNFIKSEQNQNIITFDDINNIDLDFQLLNYKQVNKKNIISMFYNTYNADFSEYAIMPFYQYFFDLNDEEKIEQYLKSIFSLENIEIDDQTLKEFATLINNHSERTINKIPFIKIQNAKIETECINSQVTEEVFEELKPETIKLLEENIDIKNIILNFNKYLNNFALASGIALFFRNDVNSYEKETYFGVKKIYNKNIKFFANVKQNILTPVLDIQYNKETGEYKISFFKSAKGIFLDNLNNDLTFKEKNFFPKEVQFEFNKGFKKIILDFYNYSVKNNFNLNTSFLFLPKNKGFVAAIDESHKNTERNMNFFRHNILNKGVNISVSGTLMNGTPKDIPEKLIAENTNETIQMLLQKNMGIFTLEMKELWKNISQSMPAIKEQIKTNKVTNFEMIKNLVYNKITNKMAYSLSLSLANNADNIKKKITHSISKYIYENINKIDYLNEKEIFLNACLINNVIVKEMPGISNPTGISNLIFNYPNLSLSLKDATNRIWDFKYSSQILNGLNPIDNTKDEHYLNYLNQTNTPLADLYIMFESIIRSNYFTIIKKIKKMIDDIIIEILEDKQKFNTFKTFFPNNTVKELYKFITPEKASQKDTIGNIFFLLLKQSNENVNNIEKINFLKKLFDLIKNNVRFQKEFILNKDIDFLKIFEKYDIDNNFNFIYKETNQIIPSYIYIDLNDIFPIFKDRTDFKINIYSNSLKEIQTELLNAVSFKIAESAVEGYNPVLFSSRIDLLILKTAETIEQLARNLYLDVPVYLLLVKSNSENFDNFVKNIDEKKLAQKNIFIKVTTPQNFYNDYHYNIPTKANIITAAIYSALAEGYRLNRYGYNQKGETNKKAKIFYTGEPSNVYTFLQSAARCYMPQRQTGVEIYPSNGKFMPDMYEEDEINKNFKEAINSIFNDIFLSLVIKNKNLVNYYDFYTQQMKYLLNNSVLTPKIIEASDAKIHNNIKNMRNLLRSVLTIIEFLGGKTTIKEDNTYNDIVKFILSNKNKQLFENKIQFNFNNNKKNIKQKL